LRGRLAKFKESILFPETDAEGNPHPQSGKSLPMHLLDGRRIETWLTDLPVSNRSKLNELRNVVSLCRWAARKRYASRDLVDELAAIERPEKEHTQIGIFTPAEFAEMLNSCRVECLPQLVLAGFCGLRTAELQRLDWSDLKLNERQVVVQGAKAKTKSRRIVPLGDAAIAWLRPLELESDPIAHFSEGNKFVEAIIGDVNRARRAVVKKAAANGQEIEFKPFNWQRNGLRHSYASYRLAELKDPQRVALEMGNSANMLFSNYREIVTESQAAQWFGIQPPEEHKNIIKLEAVAA
jgi:integrase